MTSFQSVDALRAEFSAASDRAAAIVAGVFLDEILEELLRTFLVESSKGDKELFSGNGVLSNFSSKIEMSFRLGLISAEEHRTIHNIRDIRNKFAHVLSGISFQTDSVAARCKNIEVPVALVAPAEIPLPHGVKVKEPPLPEIRKAPSDDARLVFQEAVITMMHCLAARVVDAGRIRRESPVSFTEAHQPAEMVLTQYKELAGRMEKLLSNKVLPAEERASLLEDQERSSLLIRVQEFCIAQIRKAHQARKAS